VAWSVVSDFDVHWKSPSFLEKNRSGMGFHILMEEKQLKKCESCRKVTAADF
jgi:hypothetical protein